MSWVDPQAAGGSPGAPGSPEAPSGGATETTWGDLAGLEAWTGASFTTPTEQAQAQAALDASRQTIRDLTGQWLSLVTDDLLIMDWNGGRSVFLPELPVDTVTLVETRSGVDGLPQDAPEAWAMVDVGDYSWSSRTGELRLASVEEGWRTWATGWAWWPGGELANLRVTYDHGYDPMPDNLTQVLYAMASRSLAGAATGGIGVKQETLGSYSVSYDNGGGGAAAGLTGWEASVIERYRSVNRA